MQNRYDFNNLNLANAFDLDLVHKAKNRPTPEQFFVIFMKGVSKKTYPCPILYKCFNFEREKLNIFVNLKAQKYFWFIIHSEYYCLVCQAMILPIYLTCPSSPAHGE